MNSATARLIRSYTPIRPLVTTSRKLPYRQLKRSYNKLPWTLRHRAKKEMRGAIADVNERRRP